MTGGTSGLGRVIQPLTLADTEKASEFTGLAWRWAGLEGADVATFNVGLSNHTGGWTFLTGAWKAGRAPYLIAHESFPARIDLMRLFGVNVMFCTPSVLNGLTAECHKRGQSPRDLMPGMKSILLGAEAYPVSFAERMAEEWDAAIHEGYGSTESHSAHSASTCEEGAVVDGRRGIMHFVEPGFLMEVVDPHTGLQVAPGETGLLVITTLDKHASPLLRYNSGDKVVWLPHSSCACGRPFAGMQAGSIGRWDDMVKIKNVSIWPADVDEIVFTFDRVQEYQADIFIGEKGRDEARLKIALAPGSADGEYLGWIQAELKRRLEVTFDVVAVPRDELPTFTTAEKKARRWTDTRQRGLTGHAH
jgi:phenylacetate-CoA ligase